MPDRGEPDPELVGILHITSHDARFRFQFAARETHQTLNQCWPYVGPSSKTLAHHSANFVSRLLGTR